MNASQTYAKGQIEYYWLFGWKSTSLNCLKIQEEFFMSDDFDYGKYPCMYTCGEYCVGLEKCVYSGRCAVKDFYKGKILNG
jgi:hypothetical protein